MGGWVVDYMIQELKQHLSRHLLHLNAEIIICVFICHIHYFSVGLDQSAAISLKSTFCYPPPNEKLVSRCISEVHLILLILNMYLYQLNTLPHLRFRRKLQQESSFVCVYTCTGLRVVQISTKNRVRSLILHHCLRFHYKNIHIKTLQLTMTFCHVTFK